MSTGVTARKRLGGAGGFVLGCGCKDAKAVAAAVSASSLCSTTETSTATTATWSRARTHPSASTATLTVPSASSSFLWEDAEAEADGDEVDCKRESPAATQSFSGLLHQLNELEQSVMLWGRIKSPRRNYSSPPPPLPLPSRPVQHRSVHSRDKRNSKEGHGNFSPPPPPPLPSRPLQHRALLSSDKRNSKEGHGNFSPPRPRPPPPSFQFPTQQHRRVKSVDKVSRQEGDMPPQQPRNVKTVDRGNSKGDGKRLSPPKHRKAKSCDNNDGSGGGSLDGSVAVVKQSEDPLGDFRRSMLNMIVENRIVTGDELRELLRRFLALNAPHHHDAILRAFAEIWDEVFATAAAGPHREPTRPTAPRQRTPPRRRHPPPAWRL